MTTQFETFVLVEMAVDVDRSCIKRMISTYENKARAEDALALLRDVVGDVRTFDVIPVPHVD